MWQTNQELETALTEYRQQLDLLSVSTTTSQDEMKDLIRSLTEVECLVADLTSSTLSSTERKESLEADLRSIEDRIKTVEGELGEVEPSWKAKSDETRVLAGSLAEASTRLEALYAKKGRAGQFATVQDRNVYLHSQMAGLKTLVSEAETRLVDVQARSSEAGTRLVQVEEEQETVRAELDDTRSRDFELVDELRALREKEGTLADERKEAWREDAKLESTVHHAKEELKAAERHLSTMMDRVSLPFPHSCVLIVS